jgi:hypothetical protein
MFLMNFGQPCFILWLVLDGLDMVLEGRPGLVPRTLCFYCKTLARVMESSGSSSDSPPLDNGSHILRTLDSGQIGLV